MLVYIHNYLFSCKSSFKRRSFSRLSVLHVIKRTDLFIFILRNQILWNVYIDTSVWFILRTKSLFVSHSLMMFIFYFPTVDEYIGNINISQQLRITDKICTIYAFWKTYVPINYVLSHIIMFITKKQYLASSKSKSINYKHHNDVMRVIRFSL